jgi:glutamine synthetase
MSKQYSAFQNEIDAFINTHGKPSRVEILLPDMNGRLRGKSLPADGLAKLAKGGVRMPWGTQALDIWGVDVDGVGLGAEIGDPDGICRAVPGTLAMADAAPPISGAGPVAQVLISMDMPDGSPCFLDPRERLRDVLSKFESRGLTPVIAVELEFYLVTLDDEKSPAPTPPERSKQPKAIESSQVYDMETTEDFAPILNSIATECARLNIPADTTISEFGPGQFEINLLHNNNAMSACDQAILFKRIVRRAAKQQGFRATFMAKVYGDKVGSGCHIHASMIDSKGDNIFAASGPEPSPNLLHAVAGCLATAPDITAIFAPHLNSYRRLAPGAFAPAQLNWGGDHRGVAIRLPEIAGPAARMEHRLAGADVNPYLHVAAVLAGMLHGLDTKDLPAHRVADGATEICGPRLTHDWLTAIEDFASSEFVKKTFGAQYQNVYAHCRRAEHAAASRVVTDFEYATYLHRL